MMLVIKIPAEFYHCRNVARLKKLAGGISRLPAFAGHICWHTGQAWDWGMFAAKPPFACPHEILLQLFGNCRALLATLRG